jgi:hypothetical protein
MLALMPRGGSIVIFTERCSSEIGKFSSGEADRIRRNVSLHLLCAMISSSVASSSGSRLIDRWQLLRKHHVPSVAPS